MNSKKMLGILLMISVMINVTFVIGTNLSKVPKDNKNYYHFRGVRRCTSKEKTVSIIKVMRVHSNRGICPKCREEHL